MKETRSPREFLEDWASILFDGDNMEPAALVKDAYKSIVSYLHHADKRPFCPDCKEVMVKEKRNDLEEPGWRIFWVCACKTPQEVTKSIV